jgi:hypothetical protein
VGIDDYKGDKAEKKATYPKDGAGWLSLDELETIVGG